jgi:hypothetical protein
MPWLKFERDQLWKPAQLKGHVAIQFKKGMTIFATREAAEVSKGSGAARDATPQEIEDARQRR